MSQLGYSDNFFHVVSKNVEDKKYTVLIVDDEPDNLLLLKRTLRLDYNVISASSGEEALKIVETSDEKISLVISDQRMPSMSGTELLSKVLEKYPDIMRVLLTGHADIDTLIESINQCELFQYTLKPFDPDELKISVQNAILIYQLNESKKLIQKDLKEMFFTTVKAISSALDAKDSYTRGHSTRVTMYSLILAKELGMDEKTLEELETAALMHDIGKIGIPERILCKQGGLTDEEFTIIKSHPEQGRKILNGIKKLSSVVLWLGSHHERWDGMGYPNALKEQEIPIVSRILSIADTYDAMTSDRSYRKGLAHEIAIEEIKRCAGSQFDPDLVDLFVKINDKFKIAKDFPDKTYKECSILYKRYSI